MTKGTKNILITTGVLIGVFGITAIVLNAIKNKKKPDPEVVTAEGFNGIVLKAKRKHPSVYAWWDNLTPFQQSTVENTMTPELLIFLDEDFSNRTLSSTTMQLLRKAGYAG